jgi:putative hemolysin
MQTTGAVDSVLEDDGSLVLDGLTRLDELQELVSVRVDPSLRDQVDTVGGLIMAALKRLPQVGDEVVVDGRAFKVLALDGRRVAAVQVSPPRNGDDAAVRNATPSG